MLLNKTHLICLQGLVEQHKLIVGTQLCMAVLKRQGSMVHAKFDYLLRGPKTFTSNQLKEWVPDSAWAAMQALKVRSATAQLGPVLRLAGCLRS